MKALIFSVSAGGGHGHAAEAVKNHILLNEPDSEVKIIDTIKYINPILDKVIIGSYLKTIKITPSLFGKLYDLAETDDSLAVVSSKINELMASRLMPLINKFRPDILISTHAFPTEMLSILKLKHNFHVPSVTILTDYAPHSFWIHPGIDAYIVSNSDMTEEMLQRGVDSDKIYALGIPVNPDFIKTYSRKETLNELKLSENKPTVLMMGGSLGMGSITNIYSELINIDIDFQVIAIAGNNKKLYSELSKLRETTQKETRIIGYTQHVNKYMQCCDLLITKPGGLTITESLICNIPLAIFSVIPGQEEKNAEFLLRHKLAISLGDGKDCKSILQNILLSTNILKSMKKNCKIYSKPNSGEDIYKLIKEQINSTAVKNDKSSKN